MMPRKLPETSSLNIAGNSITRKNTTARTTATIMGMGTNIVQSSKGSRPGGGGGGGGGKGGFICILDFREG